MLIELRNALSILIIIQYANLILARLTMGIKNNYLVKSMAKIIISS